MDKPLKAFIVETDDPEESTIQFATTNVAARRQGANEIGTDFGYVSCKRVPWADQYAGCGVPPAAFIANGWRYECATCGDSVDSETEAPAYGMDLVFCSDGCMAAEVADRKAEDERKQAVIDAVLAKFPGITSVQAYVRHEKQTAYFMFPGGKYSATWVAGEVDVSISKCDVDAWHAWRAAVKAKEVS